MDTLDSIVIVSLFMWGSYFAFLLAISIRYRDYLTSQNQKLRKIDGILITFISIAVVLIIYQVFVSILKGLAKQCSVIVAVFLIILAFIFLRSHILNLKYRRAKVEGPYRLNDVTYYIRDIDTCEAWYDPRKREITITRGLINILNSGEIRFVIYHEEGHHRNIIHTMFAVLSIFIWALVLSIFLSLIAINMPTIDFILTEVAILLPILGIASLGVTLINWISEHEADLYASSKTSPFLAASTLLKIYLNPKTKIHIDFLISDPELKVRLNILFIMKILFINSMFKIPKSLTEIPEKPLIITHPPLTLRLYAILKNSRK